MDAPTVQVLSIDVIVSDPKIRRGRPVIKGTGIRVMDIVLWMRAGETLETIAENWNLPLSHVYAAATYYYLYQDEVDEDIRHYQQDGEQALAALVESGKAQPLE